MDRRAFLGSSTFFPLLLRNSASRGLEAQELDIEKGAPSPDPIPEPHFPDRLHLFVWRNWELANTDRLAQVLGATAEQILEIGSSLGLPQKPELTADQLRRIYITVIRQNWHVLPDDQLMELLGWDHRHYEYTLKEDDFLWIKLGLLKPRCERLRYEPPSAEARRRAAEIKQLLKEQLGAALDETGEPPFEFVTDLSSNQVNNLRDPESGPAGDEVDLSRGWVMAGDGSQDQTILSLAQEFQTFMQAAFGAQIGRNGEAATKAGRIQLSIDPAVGGTPGGFELHVQPEEIRLTGRDLGGLRQALYLLETKMEARGGPYFSRGLIQRTSQLDPRYAYSYFALYGDPLMEADVDPFPNGFLEKLARSGVNGVWLQAVLRNLAPSRIFPEFGEGAEIRLRNLRTLVDRAHARGVKVYLYLNEPRSMPTEFFARYPQIKGTFDADDPHFHAMCTSSPEVREWIRESLAHIFGEVGTLGGVFAITASENLTNCYSHGRAQFCPRCSKRSGDEVVAEVIQTLRDGVRKSSDTAGVIAWDWGWGEDWIKSGASPEGIIARLPTDVELLSVSEWDKPIDRGGVRTKVGEYSISVVGPGPRALRNWESARRRGLGILAKVQWNNSWEISAVPYIPVPNLIVEHCENLRKARIRGLMISWTLGGYPSPIFDAVKQYYFSPTPDSATALQEVAVQRYGRKAAPLILQAWELFSRAFQEFPMEGGDVVYHLPMQHGPANPLRVQPTGYKATMTLYPYDDYRSWTGSYPPEIAEAQLEKLARIWQSGLDRFREALALVPSHKQAGARKDVGVAETCYLHSRSAANQIHFVRLRDDLASVDGEKRKRIAKQMVEIAQEETRLAEQQYVIARKDSRIAYEATCHYFYRPLDLLEKILNCHEIIKQLTMT
jgi:hypothetical protein